MLATNGLFLQRLSKWLNLIRHVVFLSIDNSYFKDNMQLIMS